MTEIVMDLPFMYSFKKHAGNGNIGRRTARTFGYLKTIIDEDCKRAIAELKESFGHSQRNGDAEGQAAIIRCARTCRDDFQQLVQELEEASSGSKPSLPTAAPVLWLDRENRKETPPEFIKREYAAWLGHGLTQAHILHLDKPLYTALHKWLHQPQGGVTGAPNNQMPDWLDLPTRKQMNDRLLEKQGIPNASESWGKAFRDADAGTKERIRLYNIARKRANRGTAMPKTDRKKGIYPS